jgi:hypothetical protein
MKRNSMIGVNICTDTLTKDRYPKFVYSSEGHVLAIERVRKLAFVSRLTSQVGMSKRYRIVQTSTVEDGQIKEWIVAKGNDWEDILKAYYYLVHEISKESSQRRSVYKP